MYTYIRRGLLPGGSGDVDPAGADGTVYPGLHPQAAAPGTGTITSGEAHGPHGRSAESALNLPAMHTSHPPLPAPGLLDLHVAEVLFAAATQQALGRFAEYFRGRRHLPRSTNFPADKSMEGDHA